MKLLITYNYLVVAATNSTNVPTVYCLFFLDFTCDAFQRPEPVYRKLLELSPKSALGVLAEGVHAWQSGNSAEAVREGKALAAVFFCKPEYRYRHCWMIGRPDIRLI